MSAFSNLPTIPSNLANTVLVAVKAIDPTLKWMGAGALTGYIITGGPFADHSFVSAVFGVFGTFVGFVAKSLFEELNQVMPPNAPSAKRPEPKPERFQPRL